MDRIRQAINLTSATTMTLFSWILLLSTSASLALSSEPPSAGKYISPDRSFELSVFPGYRVHTGKDKLSRSYIPVCHADSLVCITLPPGQYEGTTFEDASVEVTLLASKTMQGCLNPGKYEVSLSPDAAFQIDGNNPSRIIDGTRFLHAFEAGSAMSHDIATDRYRGYKNGRCYELALHIAFSNFKVYPPGTIKDFTRQEQRQVRAHLERILDSFRSLNSPVRVSSK